MILGDTPDLMAKDVGNRLRSARKAKDISRAVAAERLGITVAAIQHHESGDNGKGPLDAREPAQAVQEVWDAIPADRQPQAFSVLQTFVPKEKDPS